MNSFQKIEGFTLLLPKTAELPVVVEFEGACLRLDLDDGKFAGYEPHRLLRLCYYTDGSAWQPEYFPELALEFALECMALRANSGVPLKATGKGPSLESLISLDAETARLRAQACADLAAHKKHFALPLVSHMEPIPPNDNPFWHDAFSMGTTLVRDWVVMHGGFDRPESPRRLDYLILINGRTGQRIKVVPQTPARYTYRSLPCTDSPDDWCVFGKTRDGATGVLEWCQDQKDAEEMFRTMREYDDFVELRVCRFNNPESTTYSWEELK